MRWLPASWKSTYAKTLVEQWYKRLNKDLLREMLDFWIWSKSNEKIINSIEYDLIQSLLEEWYNVVVDDTNISYERVLLLEAIWEWAWADIEIKTMETSLEECIERDKKRERPVWEEVIIKFNNQLNKK